MENKESAGNKAEDKPKRPLAKVYDHLLASLDQLEKCSYTELESTIKRTTAVRLTSLAVIDLAKLAVAARKLKMASSLDDLFSDQGEAKQVAAGQEPKKLGAGEQAPVKK